MPASSKSPGIRKTGGEDELRGLALELAERIQALQMRREFLPRIALRGPMGAGKSTFARFLLDALRVSREAEGSPTFAIAHEYASEGGLRIVHADGYRLGSEAELEATGLVEVLWEPEVLVLFEWMDLFPGVDAALKAGDLPYWEVRLEFDPADPNRREMLFCVDQG